MHGIDVQSKLVRTQSEISSGLVLVTAACTPSVISFSSIISTRV